MNTQRTIRRWLAPLVLALAAGCGGDGGGEGQGASSSASANIGPAGGSVMLAGGAQVLVPVGALASSTIITVEATAAGAPELPQGFGAAGAMFAFTPHGTTFSVPVTVSVPVNPAAMAAGTTPTLYKTDAAGTWQRVPGAVLSGGLVTAQVTGFSHFVFGAAPPFIAASQQPQDTTVTAGSTAAFSVTALGAPPFSYQWQRSTDAGATFADIAGATARTHTTAATVLGDNDTRFRVIVSNPDGPTTSQAATLTVTAVVIAPPASGAAGAVLAAGDVFSVALQSDGTLRSWGFGALGRLGDGGATGNAGRASPGPVVGLSDIVALDSGGGSTLALRRNGEVWGWGNNAYGQLGDGTAGAAATATRFAGTAALRGVRAIAMSGLHSLVLRDDGRIEAAGSNRFGELGNLAVVYSTSTAVEVTVSPGMKPVVAIAAGDGFSVALDEDGVVWTWGTLAGGPLGNVPITSSNLPQRVGGIDPVALIAAGPSHVLAVARDGRLWSWGNNYSFGMLGRGGVGDFDAVPGRVALAGPVVAIAAGFLHSVALQADGSVFTWGGNTYGELGTGSLVPASRDIPARVASLPGGVRAIAAGALGHSLAVAPDGRVWAWGFNAYGQVGDGTAVDRPTPVPITGLNLN